MLKRFAVILAAGCWSISYAAGPVGPAGSAAPAGSPSDASVKELLEVTHARQLADSIMAQLDGMMKGVMQQITQGQPAPAQVQKTFDQTHADVMKMVKEEFTWDKLEPMYVRIYQKSFTQSELDSILAFYKTPAGQSVINKMPVVMQNTMKEVQQMMGPMIQRIEKMQHDMVTEMRAENAKKEG